MQEDPDNAERRVSPDVPTVVNQAQDVQRFVTQTRDVPHTGHQPPYGYPSGYMYPHGYQPSYMQHTGHRSRHGHHTDYPPRHAQQADYPPSNEDAPRYAQYSGQQYLDAPHDHSRSPDVPTVVSRARHVQRFVSHSRDGPQAGSYYRDGPHTGSHFRDGQHPGSHFRDGQHPGSHFRDGQHPGSHYRDGQHPGSHYRDGQHPGSHYRDGPHTGSHYRDGPHTSSYYRDGLHTGSYYRDGPHTGSYYRDGQHTASHPRDEPTVVSQTQDGQHTASQAQDGQHTASQAQDMQPTASETQDVQRTVSQTQDMQHTALQTQNVPTVVSQAGEGQHPASQTLEAQRTDSQAQDMQSTASLTTDVSTVVAQAWDVHRFVSQTRDVHHTASQATDGRSTASQVLSIKDTVTDSDTIVDNRGAKLQLMSSSSIVKFRGSVSASESKFPTFKKHRTRDLSQRCGLGCITCSYLQRFNNMPTFLLFYYTLTVCQGIVLGLAFLSIDTFERDYFLNPFTSSALSLTYDIASLLVLPLISNCGKKENTPKLIAFASFLVGLGTFLLGYPYLDHMEYEPNIEFEEICLTQATAQQCKLESSLRTYYTIFSIAGRSIHGIAAMIIYLLGMVFIDDSVALYSVGTHFGILDASVVLGYALSHMAATRLVDNHRSNATIYTVEESEKIWRQRWWFCFLVMSSIALFLTLPLACFPHNIQGTAKIRSRRLKIKRSVTSAQFTDLDYGDSLFAPVGDLMKKRIFLFLALSKASDSFLLTGVSEFLSPYLENQFILTPNVASKLSGFVFYPGGAVGMLLGGIIVSKLQLGSKALMKFILISSTVTVALLSLVIFAYCETPRFAGINDDYDGSGMLGNLSAPCNSHCYCSSSVYTPICGRDDAGYFSPCYAGCGKVKATNNTKIPRAYYECSCITAGLTTQDDDGEFLDAKSGICDPKCYKLPLFLTFIFSASIFSGFSTVPNNLAIMRSVPDKQRLLALCVTYMILRTVGTIPGVLIFKQMEQMACIFRNEGQCGEKGKCWFYNKAKIAYLFIGIFLFSRICSIFFTISAFRIYKNMEKAASIVSLNQKIQELKQTRI